MAADLLLLDGGMGHELKARGVRSSHPGSERFFLAGALANEEQPELVAGLHAEYLRAGVDVVTTNSFVVVPSALEPVQREADLEALVRAAVRNAKAAVASVGRGRIAGCLPPLYESYIPSQVPADAAEALGPTYRRLARCLVAEGCPILLCETMSCVRELVAAVTAAAAATQGTATEVWASVTLDDDEGCRLRSGESLPAAVAAITAPGVCPPLRAVLVNCCSPAAVTAALTLLAALPRPSGCRIGGYANGFLVTTSEWLAGGPDPDKLPPDTAEPPLISPADYAAHCERWRQLGASVIGGCCGTGPQHMAAVAKRFGRLPGQPPGPALDPEGGPAPPHV